MTFTEVAGPVLLYVLGLLMYFGLKSFLSRTRTAQGETPSVPGTLGAVLRNAERGLAETRREIEGMHALSTVPRDPGVIPDLQCFLGCTPRDAVRMSGLDPESAANLSRRINLLLSDKRAPVTCDWNELQKHAGNGTWHHLRGLTYILLRADPSAQVRLIGGERPLWFMNGRLDEEDVRMLVTRFYY